MRLCTSISWMYNANVYWSYNFLKCSLYYQFLFIFSNGVWGPNGDTMLLHLTNNFHFGLEVYAVFYQKYVYCPCHFLVILKWKQSNESNKDRLGEEKKESTPPSPKVFYLQNLQTTRTWNFPTFLCGWPYIYTNIST